MSFLSTPIKTAVNTITQQLDTPFFVYDLDQLNTHLARLVAQTDVKLWYAVKANPLSKIIQSLDSAGFNFDVASKGELEQVLAQGISSQRVLNTGPAKSPKQIKHFIERGVRIFVAESLNQVRWLNQQAQLQNTQLQVLLRVQLRWPEGEKNPLGGDSLTPFGLGCNEWQALNVADYPALKFDGLHIFQWGNMLSTQKLSDLWSQMIAPLSQLASDLNISLKILDLGGGLGIDYLNEGKQLSWQQIITDLADIKAQSGVEELWLELGRFAVAECGYYVVPVVDRKINYDQEQLVLAAGINHIIRPAITDQPFPVTLLRNSNAQNQAFDLHGPLCTSMDKLGHLMLPEDVVVDDKLVFGYCGAYGFTESMPFFLCHQLAAEYVFQGGALVEVRPAQPATSYLA